MTRIQRYLFRNLAVATFYSALGLTMTIWLSQSRRLIELVVEAGAPLRLFVWMLVLTMPTFLGVVLPIALIGGLLFIYNRMTMDSELVVMRAAGVGPVALGKPALLLGVLVAGIVLSLNLYVTPMAHRALVSVEQVVRNDYTQILLREGVFNEVGNRLSVYARKRDSEGNLFHILIHDTRVKDRPVTTMGERAVMQAGGAGARIIVYNGYQQELSRETGKLSQLYFDRYAVDLQLLTDQAGDRKPDARERSTAELFDPPPEMRGDERAMRQFIAELHNRLSSPLLALAFTMVALGCLLSGEFNRRGQGVRIGAAIAGAAVLQAAALGLNGLATKSLAIVPLMYLVPLGAMIGGAVVLARGLGPAGIHGGRSRRLPLIG